MEHRIWIGCTIWSIRLSNLEMKEKRSSWFLQEQSLLAGPPAGLLPGKMKSQTGKYGQPLDKSTWSRPIKNYSTNKIWPELNCWSPVRISAVAAIILQDTT